jgi:glycosyltransferase involved in cell wall biosynthesis
VRRQLIGRGVPAEHVQAIYTPVVLTPRLEHSTLRDELELSADAILVGCVAVLRPDKGHLELINAMLPLLRTRPKLHLVLAGGGSPGFEQLQAHSKHSGVSDRIHMLGTRRDVPNVLAGLDIFCLATRQEAMGTAFLEAAASGLPVIGTDVGGVGEMMRPGETGLLVPLDDAQALQSALIQLIDSPALRAKMGQAGYQRVHTEGIFTTETLAKRTECIYDQWLRDLRPSLHAERVLSQQTTDRH